MHLTLRRAVFWALGIAGLVFALPQSSHGEEFPGLPDPDGISVYNNAAQGGLAYAKRAKQWLRSPDGMVTFIARSVTSRIEGECGNGHKCTKFNEVGGQAFIVSPKGAPANYGYLAPVTVRSVGFGLMPVEATVQISQRRKDGFPIPFQSTVYSQLYYDTAIQPKALTSTAFPVDVKDAMNVQILKVLVDGVDLDLTGDCRTVTPAPMTMTSPKYVIENPDDTREEWFRQADPNSFFSPAKGGTLNGTIDIPPFTGCTTASGDDLSDLMTLTASGPGNPVFARIGWRCFVLDEEGSPRPLRAGENTPKAAQAASEAGGRGGETGDDGPCNYGTQKFEYPTRPAD
jgi:hypothetical protein